jgi:hypothetical protein
MESRRNAHAREIYRGNDSGLAARVLIAARGMQSRWLFHIERCCGQRGDLLKEKIRGLRCRGQPEARLRQT